MTPEKARCAALRALGNPALLRDQARSTWTWHSVESCWRDLRYGTRALSHAPGFAAIAILIIALGLGANVAMFTIVRGLLLTPSPRTDGSPSHRITGM